MKKMLFVVSLLIAIVLTVASALADAKDEVVWFIPKQDVTGTALSPDGMKLYDDEWAGGDTERVVIRERNTQNGNITHTFVPENIIHSYGTGIIDIVVSNDGKYLAANYGGAPIIIFNLETGKERQLFLKNTYLTIDGIQDISISPDSKKIIGIHNDNNGGYFDCYMVVFDLVTGDSLYYKRYNTSNPEDNILTFYQVEFSPDNEHFVTVGSTLTKQEHGPQIWKETRGLLVWDAKTYQCVKLIEDAFNPGFAIQGPPTDYLTIKFSTASGIMGFGHDNMINFYNYHNWDTVNTIKYIGNANAKIFSFAFNKIDGKNVFICGHNGIDNKYETFAIDPFKELYKYDTIFVTNPVISPDDKFIYAENYNGIFKLNALWESSGVAIDPKAQEILTIYPNPSLNILKIEIKVSIPENCSITINDLTGKTVQTIFNGFLENSQVINFQTKTLSAGDYFVTLTTPQNVITKQFVKGN